MGKTMAGAVLTGLAVAVGFAVGFGIGKKTREAAPGNVKTNYSDGKVTIVADVAGALKTGVSDYLNSL